MRKSFAGSSERPGRGDQAGSGSVRRRLKIATRAGVAALLMAFAIGCTTAPGSTAAGSAASFAQPPAGSGDSSNVAAATSAAAMSAAPSSAAAAPASAPGGAPSKAPAPGESAGSGAGVNIPAGVQAEDRQIVRTASVTVDVAVKSTGKGAEQDNKIEKDAFDRAVQRVTALGAGRGYVSAMQGHDTTMSITLRVPAGT
jgi:hypothetical protein